jgi:hypothetical protein
MMEAIALRYNMRSIADLFQNDMKAVFPVNTILLLLLVLTNPIRREPKDPGGLDP